MRIKTQDLETLFSRMIEHLRGRCGDEIELPDMDFYWVVQAPEWVEFGATPAPSVGSLDEDWKLLSRLLEREEPVSFGDLDRLAYQGRPPGSAGEAAGV
jgi:hypothetical protein